MALCGPVSTRQKTDRRPPGVIVAADTLLRADHEALEEEAEVVIEEELDTEAGEDSTTLLTARTVHRLINNNSSIYQSLKKTGELTPAITVTVSWGGNNCLKVSHNALLKTYSYN